MISSLIKYKADLYKKSGESNDTEYNYYKTVNAQIYYKSASNIVEAYQVYNRKVITIKIRYRKDIDESMRIKIGNLFYEILSIQPVGLFNTDLQIDLASIL